MPLATWDDFQSKYGFGDGSYVTGDDFEARSHLVAFLNEHPGMIAAGLRALEYDRPGFHNPCLVILVKTVEGLDDVGLLKRWLLSETLALESLPDPVANEIEDLVVAAYKN